VSLDSAKRDFTLEDSLEDSEIVLPTSLDWYSLIRSFGADML
jgi:hypothetical protein